MTYLQPEELEGFISPLIMNDIYHTELARSLIRREAGDGG